MVMEGKRIIIKNTHPKHSERDTVAGKICCNTRQNWPGWSLGSPPWCERMLDHGESSSGINRRHHQAAIFTIIRSVLGGISNVWREVNAWSHTTSSFVLSFFPSEKNPAPTFSIVSFIKYANRSKAIVANVPHHILGGSLDHGNNREIRVNLQRSMWIKKQSKRKGEKKGWTYNSRWFHQRRSIHHCFKVFKIFLAEREEFRFLVQITWWREVAPTGFSKE